jgi:hypothetical protein
MSDQQDLQDILNAVIDDLSTLYALRWLGGQAACGNPAAKRLLARFRELAKAPGQESLRWAFEELDGERALSTGGEAEVASC